MNNSNEAPAPTPAIKLAVTPSLSVVRIEDRIEDRYLDFAFVTPTTARAFANRMAREGFGSSFVDQFMEGRSADINPYAIPADAWETITA